MIRGACLLFLVAFACTALVSSCRTGAEFERGDYFRGPSTPDEELAWSVRRQLQRHGPVESDLVRVSVSNGVVTLDGEVNSRAEKERLGRVAASAGKTKRVENRLRVTGGGPGEK